MIFLQLFWTFFKIGLFTFGGGYAMLPLIQEEVLNKGWIAQEFLVNFVAVSESTPGPFAINMATYVGSEVGLTFGNLGVFGAFIGSVVSTLGVVLPSFIIILLVAKIYDKFKKSKTVKGLMSGLKPTVIGLMSNAVLSIALTVFFPLGLTFNVFTTPQFYVALVLFVSMCILAFKKVNPIIIIGISALIGVLTGYIIGI